METVRVPSPAAVTVMSRGSELAVSVTVASPFSSVDVFSAESCASPISAPSGVLPHSMIRFPTGSPAELIRRTVSSALDPMFTVSSSSPEMTRIYCEVAPGAVGGAGASVPASPTTIGTFGSSGT